MDSIRKNRFKRTLLSSAILISIQGFSSTVSADTCPPPNAGNNIHVPTGEYCNGGIAPDVVVNDIGIEGYVTGDVINTSGISDFWISGGTLEGSLINNDTARDLNISNGSRITANIHNPGEMRSIRITNGSSVDGAIINEGDLENIELSGANVRVGEDIYNGEDGVIAENIYLGDGATVAGNIINDGEVADIVVDGATVGQSVINNGQLDEIVVMNGGHVQEDVVNEGQVMAVRVDGSTIGNNLVNHGLIEDDGISVDSSAINGAIINAEDGLITANRNAISLSGQTAVGAIVNRGTISAGHYGIYVDGSGHDGASVTNDIVNSSDGVITTDDNGIFVEDGTVGGSIINDGTITSLEDNAIDIEDSVIGANIIINGNLTTNKHYDTLDINDSLILGNVITGRQSLLTSGEDGLDIDESTIDGSVISEAMINASDEGFDFDNTHITDDLINKGQISAGRTGMSFAGEIFYVPVEEELPGDGMIMADGDGFVMEANIATIGGDFVNEGEINAGERGIELELAEIGGKFQNSGTISSDTDTAIHISASTIQGDFINQGDLHADLPPAWDEGASYYSYIDLIPEGSVTLTSMGIDQHNQNWLKISNEGDTPKQVMLEEVGGGFTFDTFWIYPGQEIFINAGAQNGGEQSYQLTDTGAMEQLAVEMAGSQPFMPEIPNSEQVQQGIALVGDLYDDDELMMAGQVNIGGSFVNTGDIRAVDEGIFVTGTTVDGDFGNSGDITSLTSAGIALVDDVIITGNFNNTGTITATEEGIIFEGERWLDGEQVVTESEASLMGTFMNQGTIHSGSTGIDIYDAQIAGAFINEGDISASEDYGIRIAGLSSIGSNFLNSGNISAAEGGIVIKDAELGGSLVNTGDISSANGSVIDIDDAIINGNIENYGLLALTEDGSDGLDLNDTIVRGNIINSGFINSNGNEGIDINDSLVEGSIVNTEDGIIRASSDSIILDRSDVQGSIINDGTLIALRNDAIELNYSTIAGSVINNGVIRAGDHGIEIDGNDRKGWVVIGGNLENRGSIYTGETEDGIGNGGNGFDIDDLELRGSLINSGTIDVTDDGFDVDNMIVAGDFISTGTITAGDNGMVLQGSRRWHEAEETVDGITPEHVTLNPVTIGGQFYNSSDIQAGDTGIDLELVAIGNNGVSADGAANFENHGNITAGNAMDIRASSVAGDFVNTGELSANKDDSYATGDYYDRSGLETSPEGQVEMTSLGVDENGNAWFKVKNHGQNFHFMTLTEEGGGFSSDLLWLEPGHEIMITTGPSDGSENYALNLVDNPGNLEPLPEGLVAVGNADLDSDFTPAYQIDNSVHRGISLTGEVFDQDSEFAELVRSEVAGNFVNTGTIRAYDEGIYLRDTEIGGSFNNAGDISSESASAITISATDMGGDLINSGNLDATGNVLLREGNYYFNDWDGTPDGDGELVFTARGTDANGNAWFVVRNESDGYHQVQLTEVDGDFSTRDFSLSPGDELYINAGQLEGDLELSYPYEDGQIAIASINNDGFAPMANDRNGISLVDASVGGQFINSGEIAALDAGIYIADADLAGGVSNSGVITAGDKGIVVINTGLDGNVINTEDGSITIADGGRDGMELREVDGVESFINQGIIQFTDPSQGDGMSADEVNMSGVMANTGTITAGYGMLITDSSTTGLINDGTINSYQEGMLAINSSIDGDIGLGSDGVINAENAAGIALSSIWNVNTLYNNGTINALNSDGISGFNVEMDSSVVNAGTIEAGYHGISLYQSEMTGIYNNGVITAGTYVEQEDGETFSNGTGLYLQDSNLQDNIINDVDGRIQAATHGIYLGETNGATNILNGGSIEAGTDAIKLSGSTLDRIEEDDDLNSGNIINYATGVITAGDDAIRIGGAIHYDDGMSVVPGYVEGDIVNMGMITAEENAIDIDDSIVAGIISNSGTITSGDVTIDIGGEDSSGDQPSMVGELMNSGTLTAQNGAVVRVSGSSIGSLVNTGTLNGGQMSGDDMEAPRTIAEGSTVALDFRMATEHLDLLNGSEQDNAGLINGDIYGSSSDIDRIELAAGELNGDIYDVETIDITGTITLNNSIFSFNDSSALNVTETGTLAFGTTDAIAIEGDYTQDGTMAVVLNENTRSLAEPVINASGSAALNEGSIVSLSVEDRNIANFNPGFAGENVQLVQADSGISDNGIAIVSDSILFNYTPYTGNEGTEFGVVGTVSNLGTLAGSGGASNNAVNAISAFQGDNSEGLIDLYTSNPELYNTIYDGDIDTLTQLAELLLEGNPDNSIAASQNAQNEALNTILSRIADLRTGASGISAGDSVAAANYLRPDSLWLRAIYSDGDQDQKADFAGYSLRSKGFTLGADRDINDYLTLGLGMTMVTSTANQTSSGGGSNSETDSYLGSLYAGWRNQDYFVDASLNVGTSKTDLTGSAGEGRYDADQLALSVLAGKSLLFNNNDSLVEPSVGVNFTRLKTDSYSYDARNIAATSLKSLEMGAGIRYMTSFDLGSGQLLPEVSLMAWHDFKAEAVKAEIGFENSGGSFTYFGPEAVKNRYQASAGVEYWMDNNFTLSLNYDHNWQSGFKADTVQAKLRYDF